MSRAPGRTVAQLHCILSRVTNPVRLLPPWKAQNAIHGPEFNRFNWPGQRLFCHQGGRRGRDLNLDLEKVQAISIAISVKWGFRLFGDFSW